MENVLIEHCPTLVMLFSGLSGNLSRDGTAAAQTGTDKGCLHHPPWANPFQSSSSQMLSPVSIVPWQTSFAHRGHAAKRSPCIRAAQGSDVEGGHMPQPMSQSLCVPWRRSQHPPLTLVLDKADLHLMRCCTGASGVESVCFRSWCSSRDCLPVVPLWCESRLRVEASQPDYTSQKHKCSCIYIHFSVWWVAFREDLLIL